MPEAASLSVRLQMALPRYLLLLATVGAGLAPLAAPGFLDRARADQSLAHVRTLAHDVTVLTRQSYNYAPAAIHDGELYHLYWCAGVAGDYVLHAEARDLHGPWHGHDGRNFDTALAPSDKPGTFDEQHACDPNVLKVGAKYYLYYGGLSKAKDALTAVGVAIGDDPVHFKRLNDGQPIVSAARTSPTWEARKLTYGAGQPAATFIAPYVYLSVTDSTGSGGNAINGAGQYVLRSTDPSFATGVQEFTGKGWLDRLYGHHTAEHSILEAFGIDWAFDAATGDVMVVADKLQGQSTIYALDPTTFATLGTGSVPLEWREGPALVAEADKSLARRKDCAAMDVAVFSAAGGAFADPFSWHVLQFSEEVLDAGPLCRPRSR